MGGNATAEPCPVKLARAVDSLLGIISEFNTRMPGLASAKPVLSEKLKQLAPGVAQELCNRTLLSLDSGDPRREIIVFHTLVARLDATGADPAALTAQLAPLPIGDLKFRLAQRVARIASPTAIIAPVPDLELADPLLVGCSIGVKTQRDEFRGSVTCFVDDVDSGSHMLLTCHHALRPRPGRGTNLAPKLELDLPSAFDENLRRGIAPRDVEQMRAAPEDEVYQPAVGHDGIPVAKFLRGVCTPEIDAAVALITRREFHNTTREGTVIRGLALGVKINDPIWSRGAGSRVQKGFITGMNSFASDTNTGVQYATHLTASFHLGNEMFAPLHDEDDHGCPVFDARDNLVGMVVGRDRTSVIVTPIGRVLEALNVKLAVKR